MGKRILIIDDSPRIRAILRTILGKKGYEVVGEGENGKEALDLYQELKPDLVALDIVMPEVDGIQALKDIIAFNPQAKVIMITSADDREQFKKTLEAGALAHIFKPFQPSRVLLAVEQALTQE
jgi:two-component system chemotaxis response regulator CheY